jgi:hypothetical protein
VIRDPTSHTLAISLSTQGNFNGMKGHLVTINSPGENEFVTRLLPNSWIAVDDRKEEGLYRYSDGPEKGADVDYMAWGPDQPDNEGKSHCVQLSGSYSLPNNWNDRPCADYLPFVVEYECPAGQVETANGCTRMYNWRNYSLLS